MRVPLIVRIGVLVLVTTAFYTYVGQMVPQKEVLPPEETVLRADLTTGDMVTVGRQIMEGKGLCSTCHTIGRSGALRFPDLEGVGARAKNRVPGMSDVEYLAQSMYEPDAYIVEGFNPGMPVINKPPIGLTDQEILCVIAYLQSLGGTPTVTLQTTHRYVAPGAAPGGTPAPAAVPAPGAATGAAPPAAPPKGARLRPDNHHVAARLDRSAARNEARTRAPATLRQAQGRPEHRRGATSGAGWGVPREQGAGRVGRSPRWMER